MTVAAYRHRQAAHCESGVTAGLFCQAGVEISEPMAFGIGAGLMFAHFPFLRMGTMPLTSFRVRPGLIFKRAASALGVRVESRAFRRSEDAMRALDEMLDAGRVVGMQVGAYWLPFFPPALRFHFNGHNLIAYGREGDEYLIGDPVLDTPVRCDREALRRARYSEGAMAPRGRMYFIRSAREDAPWAGAIRRGIHRVCRDMLYAPFPMIGVKGIGYLAKRLARWPEKLGEERAAQQLAQLIRMQEEIGTGGAGFRYLYAAFLQEAGDRLGCGALGDRSVEMTAVGDRWSDFAVQAARVCKGRGRGVGYDSLGEFLLGIAEGERTIYGRLMQDVRV